MTADVSPSTPSTRAETSCKNVTSPTSAMARPPVATPRAVDKTPSMPLAPRLEKVGATREGVHHSTSRTGIDDPMTSEAPVATLCSTTTRAATISVSGPSSSSCRCSPTVREA